MIYNDNDEMPTKEWLEKHKKHEKLFKMLWPNNSEHKHNENKSKLNSNFLKFESNKNEQNDLKIKFNYDSTINKHYNIGYNSVCNCINEKEEQNLKIKSLEYELKITENSMNKIYENILDDLKLMKNEMNIIRFLNYKLDDLHNSINNKNK